MKHEKHLLFLKGLTRCGGKCAMALSVFFLVAFCVSSTAMAQGTWSKVANTSPDANNGVMLLLSDGTVMCKTNAGGGDGYGNGWNKLTPDANGSYANGSWTTLASMAKTRLYFSSQVLQDGRVFVAGGEYGSGGNYMEVYDPQLNTWGNELNYGVKISDANSEILPNGKVIVAPVNDRPNTFIWNPATNNYVAGPQNQGNTNESAWVKLPDGSILFIQTSGTQSERYMPGTNTWQTDATVPVALYEPLGAETGAAFLLPDGRAFFLGGNSNTAYYTPSGNATNGTWAAGPLIPSSLSAPDAAAAMMVDGRILCAVSPTLTCCDGSGNNIFNTPTSFYVFDYTAGANGTFTSITAPDGSASLNIPAYKTNMLVLPNGQILYSQQGSNEYYVFTPSGSVIAAGKPSITNISQPTAGLFTLTGKKLNGISEGAGYGDDWQMNTNYPIVRLTSGSNVYYARTSNWSYTGVTDGTTAGSSSTTDFTLPAGLPPDTYSLVVIANGIPSDPVPFCTPHIDATAVVTSNYHGRDVSCYNASDGAVTVNVVGATAPTYSWSTGATTQSVTGLPPGTYTVTVTNLGGLGCSSTASVTVHNTPQLTVSPAVTSNYNGYGVSCNGGNNGTASANAAGGTMPYTYNWSNGQHTAGATGLSATTYSVTVIDVNGCSASGNVTLTEPPKLTVNAGSNKVVYYGYPDSSCTTLTATGLGGGVPPYTLTWSSPGNPMISHAASIPVCPTATTIYTVTITDKNGCSLSDQVTVCVIDVRCGNKLDKVTISHMTGSKKNPCNTLCVSIEGARNHFLNHAEDQLAECGTVKICNDGGLMMMVSNGNNRKVDVDAAKENTYIKSFPNPFSSSTTVRFMTDEDDQVQLRVVDITGKEVMTLFNARVEAWKEYEVLLNGSRLSSGMYLLQLRTAHGKSHVGKLLLAK